MPAAATTTTPSSRKSKMSEADIAFDPAKPTIGIDCDEVLASFIPSLALWHNRVYCTMI